MLCSIAGGWTPNWQSRSVAELTLAPSKLGSFASGKGLGFLSPQQAEPGTPAGDSSCPTLPVSSG